jgi:thiamine pyrophosphokinase
VGHHVVVIAGGERSDVARPLPDDAVVIAADSGVDYAHELGLRVDVAVGDFDSVSPAGLARAEADGARVERHPAAKAETDLELAMGAALDTDADEIVVLGVGGGRLDHLVANLLVLASERFARSRITAYAGAARIHIVHGGTGRALLPAAIGETLTLLPVGGPATGITTAGLHYPLRGEALTPGTTRGVSNVVAADVATVELEAGTLLAIFPGGET